MRLVGTVMFWIGLIGMALVVAAAIAFSITALFIHGGIVGKGVVVSGLCAALAVAGAAIVEMN